MAKFRLVVFTNPVPGREDEYDTWYNEVHLGDVLAVPGVVAAQRFKLRAPVMGELPTGNLALYEIDADDPDAVIAEIMSRAGTEAMPLSEALSETLQFVGLFGAATERLTG